jgi:ABC-type transport system involved in multi-copper enzyme maturation permease subunit
MINSLVIAKSTFRQVIRDRILYGIVIFALLFIGSVFVISSLSLGEDIYLFSLIITLFLGASVVYDEVERKTSYFLLPKPVTRSDIINGKFIGLLAASGLTTLLMALAYSCILMLSGGGFDPAVFIGIGLQILEMAILTCVIILFSIITTPLAAIIYTILIVYIGHLLSLIKDMAAKSGAFGKFILMSAYYIFPNLEKFNVRDVIVHQAKIYPQELLYSAIYAVAYIVLVLFIAKSFLNRKEF